MDNAPHTAPITLETIAQRKEEMRQKIELQKQVMTDTAKEILSPLAPAANKGNAIMRTFNTGMAVFDGVMLGMKMMKRLRNALNRKK